MHCKYLSVAPYKALEKFSKALYGTTGGTYSARVFRPVMGQLGNFQCRLISDLLVNSQLEKHHIKRGCIIIHLYLRL